ncbi:heme-binding protein [Thalassospiraceae bacterium LMO-SO8]|nr:heme-binding protein [Alphaproteobacteria bacterium LMO-S08]WND76804.1 heme-binding protein [Thalassospiraceae bacterium LMO-SO8]
MPQMTLDLAVAIVDGALAKGRDIACAPLTVAVLDAGGHIVALKRQDDSGILRVEIAVGKAYGALGFGVGGRELREKNPKFMAGVISTAPNGMVPAPGGVLIRDPDTGRIIGACGISGDTGERDEECAVAGIEGQGLRADPGEAKAH